MKNRVMNSLLLAALALSPAPASEAHHSFAMYDQDVTHSLTGRLTRFIVGANHSQFIFQAVGEDGELRANAGGEPEMWGVETGPASSLARQGLTVKSFPLDSYFSVSLNPLRDGRPFGVMRGGIVLCGMSLPAEGCNRQTGEVFLEP